MCVKNYYQIFLEEKQNLVHCILIEIAEKVVSGSSREKTYDNMFMND